MQTRTIYLPMSVGKALTYLMDRAGGVVVQLMHNCRAEHLTGFQNRQDAIAHKRFIGFEPGAPMALLHLVFDHSRAEQLAYQGHLNGTDTHPLTHAPMWALTQEGCRAIATEVQLLMEIVHDTTSSETPCAPSSAPKEFGAGPTGFGGC